MAGPYEALASFVQWLVSPFYGFCRHTPVQFQRALCLQTLADSRVTMVNSSICKLPSGLQISRSLSGLWISMDLLISIPGIILVRFVC